MNIPVCMLKMINVAERTHAASSHSMIGPDFLVSGEVSFQVKFNNSPSDESQLDLNVSP
jgi:hypothetical protein